jgi:hypothetical protein
LISRFVRWQPDRLRYRRFTAVARYVSSSTRRIWDALRALLADDVKLDQSTYPARVGAADVGIYAKFERARDAGHRGFVDGGRLTALVVTETSNSIE